MTFKSFPRSLSVLAISEKNIQTYKLRLAIEKRFTKAPTQISQKTYRKMEGER